MQCSAISAFTRVFDALCGALLIRGLLGKQWVPALRCTAEALHRVQDMRLQLLMSADQVFSISFTTDSGIGM